MLKSPYLRFNQSLSTRIMSALGIVETKGFVGALEAANAMLKSGNVEFVSKEYIGGGYVAVIVKGEQPAVKHAVEAGAIAAQRAGELISAHALENPHEDLHKLLTKV